MPENPYAYPQPLLDRVSYVGGADDYGRGGMTLRDYFAGQALAGWMSELGNVDTTDAGWCAWSAERCYALADAMLAAREKGGA